MNRNIWLARIRKTHCPPYPCPVCDGGTISLIPKSLSEQETIQSKRAHQDDGWDLEYIDYTFSASARCANAQCNQGFKIIGLGGVEPVFDNEYGSTLEDFFKPTACVPMPNIIEIPKKCPDDVRYDLTESFALFWNHRSACANAIRYALEKLMTHQGVPTQSLSKKDPPKLIDLTLHQRIEIYSKNEPIAGTQLMALKWLGNTGSHGKKVTVEDLLTAFEILEHTLSEIIESKSKKIAALADKLTKKHS